MENEVKSRLEMQQMLEGSPSLQQILQTIKQVVWILDPGSDQIVFVNPAFEKVWGRSCESLYQDPIILIESVHPEDRVKVLSASQLDYRKSMSLSYRILRPDGGLRWISAQTFLIQVGTESTTYQVCVAEDITDQDLVDQSLRNALARSREQFTLSRRMSLARKPEAVLRSLMSASALRTAEYAAVLFFDYPTNNPTHAIDEIAYWSSVSPHTSPNLKESLSQSNLVEDLALLDLFNPSKPVILPDVSNDQRLPNEVQDLLLEWRIQSLAIFPLVALGDWIGCLLVFYSEEMHFEPVELRHIKVLVDQATITLTNLRLLKTEAESRQEAERANEIKTRFLAMISHELRTPLTSIKGFTSTLLADDVDWEPAEQRDFILTIAQETNRLQELIDHLLDLSRLEAGMLPISLKPVSLSEIIDDALPQLKNLTNEHTLLMRLPANLPEINADAKRIAQVLVNLVRNASTYTSKGTEISISANVRGKFLQINVNDHGPGIPPSEHKRVFRAFRRGSLAENGSVQGAGLGLAICKGLVEAQGGRIWIKKKDSPGATVSFTVPLANVHTPSEQAEEER